LITMGIKSSKQSMDISSTPKKAVDATIGVVSHILLHICALLFQFTFLLFSFGLYFGLVFIIYWHNVPVHITFLLCTVYVSAYLILY
jgi:hypothetical protein